jgi:hypothetical protein
MRFALALAASLFVASPLIAADQPGTESPDWFPFNISALDALADGD